MNGDYPTYIRNFFRLWAPFYDLFDILISGIRDKVVDIANANKDSRILDVATGTGKQAFAFAKRGYTIIGIDLSEDMLRIAHKKNNYGNVKFEVADAIETPFEDNYFDVSCISFALHDMPLPIREKVLEEMVRVTKPTGGVVIVDYDLPKSGIRRYLIYKFVSLYESKYYPEFMVNGQRKPSNLLSGGNLRIDSYSQPSVASYLPLSSPCFPLFPLFLCSLGKSI